MAKCRYCEKSGLSLLTNERGICKACDKSIRKDINKKLADIKDALVYIRCSMNPDIQASYCSMATAMVEKLVAYENRRLANISPSPAALLVMLQSKMQETTSVLGGKGGPERSRHDVPVSSATSGCTEPANGAVAPVPDAPTVEAGSLGGEGLRPDQAEEQDWWAWQLSEVDANGAGVKGRDGSECVRKNERIPIDCIAILDPGAIRGTLQNISSGGAFLQTDKLQMPGSMVELVINTDHGPSKAQGVVRWVRIDSLSGESPGMGIEFTVVTDVLTSFLQTRFDCSLSPGHQGII
jgi:hypothetical protein